MCLCPGGNVTDPSSIESFVLQVIGTMIRGQDFHEGELESKEYMQRASAKGKA